MSEAVLREKALLLLKRERELLSLRQRLAWTASWLAISEETASLVELNEARVESAWPRLLVHRLKYQQALLAQLLPGGLQVLGAAGACAHFAGTTLEGAVDAALGAPGYCNEPAARPAGVPATFARVMWCPIAASGERWVALVGFDERTFLFHPAFEAQDLAYFRTACLQLEALTNQTRAIRRLREVNVQLRENDGALRAARESLLASTRLAAVGAMAGQTAHEVLNPLTGIQGRIDVMMAADSEVRGELSTLKTIVTAWRAALQAGGLPALMTELSGQTPQGHSAAEDDVAALEALSAVFEQCNLRQAESVKVVRREVDRIAHTVDGLRGLARVGKTIEQLPVEVLISESVDVVAVALMRHRIELETSGDLSATVRVDRYEFIQVVTNLLRNAILAIGARGPAGRIHLDARRDEGRLSLFVEDDGIGIAAEHVPLLFEQQFTTRSSRTGTGLGLSIARALARQASGDLRLERSEPGRGSTFVLELPLGTHITGEVHGHDPRR